MTKTRTRKRKEIAPEEPEYVLIEKMNAVSKYSRTATSDAVCIAWMIGRIKITWSPRALRGAYSRMLNGLGGMKSRRFTKSTRSTLYRANDALKAAVAAKEKREAKEALINSETGNSVPPSENSTDKFLPGGRYHPIF